MADAAKMANAVHTNAAKAATAAAGGTIDEAAITAATGSCGSCHAAYREKGADGAYKIKGQVSSSTYNKRSRAALPARGVPRGFLFMFHDLLKTWFEWSRDLGLPLGVFDDGAREHHRPYPF